MRDAISAALEPHCIKLNVPKVPSLMRLENVQHLQSPISGVLKDDVSLMKLVKSLHPTPAVGGWPRADACKFIGNHEGLRRGWYAGLVGWIAPGGDGLFAVALRSALCTTKDTWAFSGAGIVEDSDALLEWEETELKLQAMARSLKRRRKGQTKTPRFATVHKLSDGENSGSEKRQEETRRIHARLKTLSDDAN